LAIASSLSIAPEAGSQAFDHAADCFQKDCRFPFATVLLRAARNPPIGVAVFLFRNRAEPGVAGRIGLRCFMVQVFGGVLGLKRPVFLCRGNSVRTNKMAAMQSAWPPFG
jgi:hypothetical protein